MARSPDGPIPRWPDPPMTFSLEARDGRARAGRLATDHGAVETPVFMPVGTAGSVKAVSPRALRADVQARIVLGNTYHLYLDRKSVVKGHRVDRARASP